MVEERLAVALEREHREIDAGFEAFASGEGEAATAALTAAAEALRRHIYLEEEFLFPALREAGMVAPVFVMLREHGEMWRALDAIDAELETHGAGPSFHPLLAELGRRLEAHNVKEEAILYPQADTVLDPAAAADLASFLRSGRTPDGWVCELARP